MDGFLMPVPSGPSIQRPTKPARRAGTTRERLGCLTCRHRSVTEVSNPQLPANQSLYADGRNATDSIQYVGIANASILSASSRNPVRSSLILRSRSRRLVLRFLDDNRLQNSLRCWIYGLLIQRRVRIGGLCWDITHRCWLSLYVFKAQVFPRNSWIVSQEY